MVGIAFQTQQTLSCKTSPTSIETRPARVAIFEEQELFRTIYWAVLAPRPDIELFRAADAKSISAITEHIQQTKPDLVILGYAFMDEKRARAIATHLARPLNTNLLLLISDYNHDAIGPLMEWARMPNVPARSIVLKKSLNASKDIIELVQMLINNEGVIDSEIKNAESQNRTKHSMGLTRREKQILGLLAQGHTNTGIADFLNIDVKTVRHHMNNLYGKLKTSTDFDNRHPRVSAARICIQLFGQTSFDDMLPVH
jgi:DNA-binding NarL/FixJ family response regulator